MKKILIPVDFSEISQHACEYALQLAVSLNAQLRLLHVCHDPVMDAGLPTYGYGSRVQTQVFELNMIEARKKIEQLVQQLKAKAPEAVFIDYALLRGIVDEEISILARKYEPDLIIMGTQGSRSFSNRFFGSLTVNVLEQLETPLLAVPDLAPLENPEHVLYASDFDPTDHLAIKELQNIMGNFAHTLHIAYVFNDRGREYTEENFSDLEKELRLHFEDSFPENNFKFHVIGQQNLIKGFDQLIDNYGIQLFSMSTHKRNFITQITQPSISKRMLKHTEIPTLVFHL